ncbi:MAG TPA: DUF4175 family protein, partial [Stellaceae bacterium]|nr:DUF4175 family protein [Stellaceae bacterium]
MTKPSQISGARFAIRLRLARAALLWERVWPACWPLLAVLGGFFAVCLFDLLPNLPGPLHAAILLGFGAAVVVTAGVAFHKIAVPDRFAARRRIEQASGLRHRPLQALTDRPSGPLDSQSTRLWQAHLRRMEAATHRLRIGFPSAGLAAHDPWGLRAVLAMLLLIGAVDAGSDWRDRLARGLAPNLLGAPAAAASLDIWITPPEYTGLPPQFLHPGAPGTIRVPTGSTLLAQVHGGQSVPRLALDGKGWDFDAVDKQNFRVSTTLASGKRLKVTQAGTELGVWPIDVIPDDPPEIAFAKPPEGTT